jgi:hypothetical protein
MVESWGAALRNAVLFVLGLLILVGALIFGAARLDSWLWVVSALTADSDPLPRSAASGIMLCGLLALAAWSAHRRRRRGAPPPYRAWGLVVVILLGLGLGICGCFVWIMRGIGGG